MNLAGVFVVRPVDQPQAQAKHGRVGAIPGLELGAQIAQVGFDRVGGDEQLLADLPIGLTARHQRQHIPFALAEGFDRPRCAGPLAEQLREAAVDVDPTAADGVQGGGGAAQTQARFHQQAITAGLDCLLDRGLPVLMADATLDETLLEAGIHRCRSLVAALSSNAANLYVVLSARGLAPQCRLIARSDSEEAERKLRLAGADQVVSPYVSGGRTMAATALRPLAVTFMDLLAGSDCEVEEFRLSDNREDLGNLAGASLAEVQLGRRTGAMVLAILPPTTDMPLDGPPNLIANPGSDVCLAPGQMLVVMGSKDQLDRVSQLLGPALIGVDPMAG